MLIMLYSHQMETDALRWFQQVADGVTVTEVSELEGVSQPGVSRALARLEAEVGAPLLRRSGRVLRMTHTGAAFKRHVDALLHELDDGLAAVSELVDPETGTVAVAFQLSLGTWLVPGLVSSFRADHPDVRFVFKQVRDELVAPVLQDGQVDVEISTLRPTDSTVRWRALLVEPLQVAMSARHPFAGRPTIGLAELTDEAFVALRPTSVLRRTGEDLCNRAGFAPTIAFEGDDLPTVLGFVAAGLGVAIVPARHGGSPDRDEASMWYADISDPGAQRKIGLAWSAERRLLPAAELFRRHVIDTARARRLAAVADEARSPRP